MLDWDDLRFFLAVAHCGTVSSAARSLQVTQPTVSRRIAAFEERLGAQLFERSGTGWTLSDIGRGMLAHAEQMQKHALDAHTFATGRSMALRGTVRVTASEWVICSLLGPALGPLLEAHPALCVELLADTRHLSLVARDADLALRPSKFTQPEVIQREVGTIAFGLYASERYLARHGMPDFGRGAPGHALVLMTDGLANLADYEWLPPLIAQARVAVRTNGREPMVTMARAGLGIACLPRALGDAVAELRLLPAPGEPPRRKLYLGVHRAARSTPRVRATYDFLAQTLRAMRALAPPA
jgi:DNA-binding transcriptional LysR family regulator